MRGSKPRILVLAAMLTGVFAARFLLACTAVYKHEEEHMKAFFKLIYKLGLRKDFTRVDRLRYIKRLGHGKHPLDDKYFFSRDAEQYPGDGDVCITDDFLGRRVALMCNPRYHFEREVIRRGFARHAVLDYMAAYARPETIVADVGANVGVYAVPLATARPDITVHAFEPNPAVAARLKGNAALNRVDNLVVHETALADAAGTADFYQFDEDVTLSSLNRHAAEVHGTPKINRVAVQTLDAIFEREAWPLSFIKIDVQGAELRVLQGAVRVLSAHRPVVLFEQEDTHFDTPEKVTQEKDSLAALMAEHHYRCFYITRYSQHLLFPVDWNLPLNGDVLALPA